jgi:FAD/FMN-containing dehydrogenase
VNTDDNVIVAEAGVILANVHEAADKAGRLFPLSLASEGSCRIGGNLATNAGGVNVLRYGNARDLCLGLEAVLADGTIIHGLKRLRKDNTGYDLRHLLIGSEGTLGIITAAALRLFPKPETRATAFLEVTSPEAALTLLHRLQSEFAEQVSSFELIGKEGLEFLSETMPEVRLPFNPPPDWMVLTEVSAGATANLDTRFEAVLGEAIEADIARDAVIAQSETQRAELWAVRESIPAANRRIGAVSSHDISVPISAIAEFIRTAPKRLKEIHPEFRINCFGHLGDGNLHYNVFPAKGKTRADYEDLRSAVKTCVHELTHQLNGSVSAEHGIGRLKTKDLITYGDPGKLAAMRSIKTALDPKGILNPGAVLV